MLLISETDKGTTKKREGRERARESKRASEREREGGRKKRKEMIAHG